MFLPHLDIFLDKVLALMLLLASIDVVVFLYIYLKFMLLKCHCSHF